jgi:hypothetical protein
MGTNDGDYDGATRAFERALEIALRTGDEALERRVLIQAARVDWWHLHLDRSVEKSTRALDLAEGAGDEQTELYARAWLVREAVIRGKADEARAHAAASLELAERLRERYWLATARVNGLWLAYAEGKWDEARRESDAGLQLQPRDARNLGPRALLEYQLGESACGDIYLERLRDALRATSPGSTIEHAEAAAAFALASAMSGRSEQLEEAEAAANIALSSATSFPIFELYARVGLGLGAIHRADAALAREQYPELAGQAGTLLVLVGIAADRLLGLLALTMHQIEPACSHFEAALAFCSRASYRPEYCRAAIDYAAVLVERAAPGDAARAAALWSEGMEIAARLGIGDLERRDLRVPGGIVPQP